MMTAHTIAASTMRAQRADTARVAVSAAPVDTLVIRPPISPRTAFLRSALVPGWGQTRLRRPTAGALFVTVEFVAFAMSVHTRRELALARRFSRDSVFVGLAGNGAPLFVRPLQDRLRSRRQQVEDWTALLIFNHLIAGADAFVAAHLWDVPANVSVCPDGRGVTVAARLAW